MMQPRKRVEMTEKAEGRTTVPQIFIDGKPIGGCDDLYALDRAGKLDPMLGTRVMSGSLTVACVQVNAGPEIEPNLRTVGDLILRAREAGADFITTPENVSMVVQGRARVLERARPETRTIRRSRSSRIWRARPAHGCWPARCAVRLDDRGSRRQPQPAVQPGWRHRGALRQDPHVRRRSRQWRKLSRDRRRSVPATRRCWPRHRGAARHDRLLRPALRAICIGRWPRRALRS